MNENWYNILIIDDHPIVTDGLEKLLCAHTHAHCTKANNLKTLTEILTRADFDLCITDLEFPGTDGFMENPQRVAPVCQTPLTLRKKSAYAPYESWLTGSFLFWLICISRL